MQDFYHHQQYPLQTPALLSRWFSFSTAGALERVSTSWRCCGIKVDRFFLPANILGTLRLRLHCDFVASSGLKLIAQWFRGLSLARSLEFIIDLSTGGNGPMISSLGRSRRWFKVIIWRVAPKHIKCFFFVLVLTPWTSKIVFEEENTSATRTA